MAKIFRQTGTVENPTGTEYGDLIIKKDGKLNTVAQNGVIVGIDAEMLGGKTEGQLSVDNAAKLGNQPPAYYAKKTEVDVAQTTANEAVCASATPRGYSMRDANGMSDGWALCMQNLPPSMQGYAYVLQTSFVASGANGKAQIAISYAYEPATVATRFYSGGNWLAWQEAMPKTGGTFSGNVTVPRVITGSVQTTGKFYAMANEGLWVSNTANTGFTPAHASAFNTISSVRFKNILGMMEYKKWHALLSVDSIKYTYKKEFNDDGGKVHYGVAAEQLNELGFTDVVEYDADGLPSGVDYSKFTPYLIALAQDHEKRITEKDAEITKLQTANTEILKRLEILEGKVK
ncbi:MAG: pyocin knob domain-containing protein [Christensenellaceae bacterium]